MMNCLPLGGMRSLVHAIAFLVAVRPVKIEEGGVLHKTHHSCVCPGHFLLEGPQDLQPLPTYWIDGRGDGRKT